MGGLEAPKVHAENYSQLEARLEENRQTQQNMLEAHRKEHAAQVDHVIRRLDSSTVKLDQLLAANDVRESALASEREAKEEQRVIELEDMRNSIQILKDEVAQLGALTKTSGEICEGLKLEFASKLAIFQQQSSSGIPANVLEEMNKLCDGFTNENSKAIRKLQASIKEIQDTLEADRSTYMKSVEEERVAFRKSHDEHMRCVQSERDARLRQLTEVRAEYGKAIQKEHEDRMADAAEQKKELLKMLRLSSSTPGGSPSTLGSSPGLQIDPEKRGISSIGHRLQALSQLAPAKKSLEGELGVKETTPSSTVSGVAAPNVDAISHTP